jgi:hypothetical protein
VNFLRQNNRWDARCTRLIIAALYYPFRDWVRVRVRVLYDLRFTANQFLWRRAPWDSRPVMFFQLNTCGHSPYITSTLTRGWVCRLQSLLGLASAVIPRSECRGTHDHILESQIPDSWNLEGQVQYLYPPGTEWPGYTPKHWVLFSSPPTTRRAMVEVFDPVDWISSK